MYAAISSRVRTGVGIHLHSSSSSPTSTSPAKCAFARGSRRTCAPSSTTGETTMSVGMMADLTALPLAQRAPIWIWMENVRSMGNKRMNVAPLRVVGSQHRSSSHRKVFAFSADSRKFPHQGSIEPGIRGLPAQSFQGILRGKRVPVRTIGDQRVVNVRNLENPRHQRYFISGEAIRIPASVHSLMVMPNPRQDAAQRFQRRTDARSNGRMLLHNLHFFHSQRPGLQENLVRYRYFSNVVKQAGNS